MKIALVNSEYPSVSGSDHGGIASYTNTLAAFLAQRGNTVHVFTRSGFNNPEAIANVQFHQFGFKKSVGIIPRFINRLSNNPLLWERGQSRALSSQLAAVAATDGLDIVEFPEYGGLACNYHSARSIPYTVTFHTPSELVDKLNGIPPSRQHRQRYRLETRALRRAAAFKSPSDALKKWASERYRLPPPSIHTIRNPFNTVPIRKIRRTTGERSQFDILFSGRFERRKGAEILLHSIKKILSIDRSIHFTIAGETEISNSANYRQSVERTLSPDERMRVWFPGPLSYKKLLPLYFNSSLFLLPSLFENYPYSLLEAMASGLPVIATSRGGITEIITHGENGLLFSPDEPETLVAHVRELFNNRDRASALGKNALTTIQQVYNTDSIVTAHCTFYESAVAGKH